MKRRTLDIMFSIGGLALAGLLLVMGLVLNSNAKFAKDYVRDQLTAQQISFKPLAALTDEEKQSTCVVANAGKLITTGKQAECYANDFIGLHVASTADGKTYAQLGTTQTDLRTQVAEAAKNSDLNLPVLQKQLTDLTAQRETLFKGETLRGLLLTSYGFSVFGVKGGEAATVAILGFALLALLSVAGLVHAFVTPKTKAFAATKTAPAKTGPAPSPA